MVAIGNQWFWTYEVLFLSIILCLANTGIVNVLVSTLYSKPDEVTGYECGLYSTKGGSLDFDASLTNIGKESNYRRDRSEIHCK